MRDESPWELQWHPSRGERVRRWWLSRRRRRAIVALLLPVLLLVIILLAALPFGARALFARLRLEKMAAENRELHGELAARREEAWDGGRRLLVSCQRARRLAWTLGLAAEIWSRSPTPTPAADADEESIVTWLTAAASDLEALEQALVEATPAPPCPLAALPSGPPLTPDRTVQVSPFGWRVSPFTGQREAHYGVTLAAPVGEPVLAPGDGRVVFAGTMRERRSNEWTRLGTMVVVSHDGGVASVLGGLREVAVKRGAQVKRGDRVGAVGQTAWTRVPALYFEIRWPVAGASRPIDPALVNLSLPLAETDARLTDPAASLPPDFARLERLPGRSR